MIKKALLIICMVGALFLLLSRVLGIAQGGVERAFSYVTYPFLVAQKSLVEPIRSWQRIRERKKALLTEFEALSKERDDLQKKVVALSSWNHHIDQTAELRNFMKRYSVES